MSAADAADVVVARGRASQASSRWWSAGDGRTLPATLDYVNPDGALGILNTAGPIETKGHPFFEPIGTNGRACVTCHQPSDAMTVSAASARERWRETGGKDPLFAAIDGKNCPNLPQDDPASHSLLLERGLIRVFLPWPPQKADGTRIDPEFTIEVVRDPTRCNTDPQYGLTSALPPSRCTGDRAWRPSEVRHCGRVRRRTVHRQERTAGGARS